MDFSSITNIPQVGWATAVAMALVLAGLVMGARREARKHREKELQDAIDEYYQAVVSRDPDRLNIAARRLRDARKRAGAS